jgi:hypothetical protein
MRRHSQDVKAIFVYFVKKCWSGEKPTPIFSLALSIVKILHVRIILRIS